MIGYVPSTEEQQQQKKLNPKAGTKRRTSAVAVGPKLQGAPRAPGRDPAGSAPVVRLRRLTATNRRPQEWRCLTQGRLPRLASVPAATHHRHQEWWPPKVPHIRPTTRSTNVGAALEWSHPDYVKRLCTGRTVHIRTTLISYLGHLGYLGTGA